jgi:hypothetical protein
LNEISISSENLSINCHPLLSEVPPLNAKYFAYGVLNKSLIESVTHQSFSNAFAEIPEILEASFIDISLEASFKFFSHHIIIMNLKDFLQQSR